METKLPSLASATALSQVAVNLLRADDRRVAVIGAGGWIGRVLLAGMFQALGAAEFDRRIMCFGSQERSIEFGLGGSVIQRPLDAIGKVASEPTLAFHLAFLTKDKVAHMSEEAYAAANQNLSATVRNNLDAIGADRLFVASSGAAAFAEDPDAAADLRLYGRLKLADEQAFGAWAKNERGRRAVIARIFSLSGPFINKHDTYALASFILAALRGSPIVVHAPMPVIRGYVAIREMLSLVIAQLLAPQGEALLSYDTGGDALELGEVAARVAATLGGNVERGPIGDKPANKYVGDASGYYEHLRQFGIEHVPLTQQIVETATTLESKG